MVPVHEEMVVLVLYGVNGGLLKNRIAVKDLDLLDCPVYTDDDMEEHSASKMFLLGFWRIHGFDSLHEPHILNIS